MTTYRVVTTCSADGWERYGRNMAISFVRFWPKSIPLTVYAEGFQPDVDGVQVAALPDWHLEFKAQHRDDPVANGMGSGQYDFRTDCVRFSHKVGAIDAAIHENEADVLIWMDADTVTHAPVDEAWLSELFDGQSYMAWLDRENKYPECGFLMFDRRHIDTVAFALHLASRYALGGVFSMPETHDSYVIESIARSMAAGGSAPLPHSLSRPGFRRGHVFANSRLSERLDHCKGDRKAAGRTPANERKVKDSVAYWGGRP